MQKAQFKNKYVLNQTQVRTHLGNNKLSISFSFSLSLSLSLSGMIVKFLSLRWLSNN